MDMKEITKTYSSGNLNVIWKPSKCIHSGICVAMLPEVYQPNRKPWITPEKADTQSLIEQIRKCPSGALTYTMNDVSTIEEKRDPKTTSMTIRKNGPLVFTGEAVLIRADGKEEALIGTTTFCRCGASENKPYCDGNHRKIGFTG